MKLLDNICEPTPKKDRIKGIISSLIGTTAAVALSVGAITLATPVLFVFATVTALFFGGKSLYHAQKTEK